MTSFLSFLYYFVSLRVILAKKHCGSSKPDYAPLVLTIMEHDYYSLFVENATDADPDATATFIGVCDKPTLQLWQPCPFDGVSEACPVHRKRYDLESIPSQKQCNCNGSVEERQLQTIPDFPTCFLGGQCMNAKCTVASRSIRRLPSIIHNCILNNAKHRDARMSLRRRFSLGRNRVKRGEITSLPGTMQFRTKCINKLGRGRMSDCRRPGTLCCPPGQKCKESALETDYFNPAKYMNELRFERDSNDVLTRILRAVSNKRHSRIRRHAGSLIRRDFTTEESVADDDEDDEDEGHAGDQGGEDIAIEESDNPEQTETKVEEPPEREESQQEQRQEMKNAHNLTEESETEKVTNTVQQHIHHKSSSQRSFGSCYWLLLTTLSARFVNI